MNTLSHSINIGTSVKIDGMGKCQFLKKRGGYHFNLLHNCLFFLSVNVAKIFKNIHIISM